MKILPRILLSTAAATGSVMSTPAVAGPRAALKVAVVVGLEPTTLNVPTVELYRAVADQVAASQAWLLTTRQDVKQRLNASAPELTALPGIPAVERNAVAAARASIGKRKTQKSKSGKKGPPQRAQVIASVQTMLDTLALDGAIIVDCKPYGHRAVSGCGVFYYDRAMGRIVAASEKSFKVRIEDVSLWAPTLVSSLEGGMLAHANKRERDRLDRVLATTADGEEPGKMTAELRLAGYGLSDPKDRITALPGAGLRFGRQSKGFATGVEVGLGKASADDAGATVNLDDRSAGIYLAIESRALDAMFWGLDLGVAYGITTARAAGGAEKDDGSLTAKSVRLRVGPGVMWEFNPGLQFGVGGSYDRHVPLAATATGAYEGTSLDKNVFGFGIRMKTVF